MPVHFFYGFIVLFATSAISIFANYRALTDVANKR